MKTERYKETIRRNAAEIVRLHSRIKPAYAVRGESLEKFREWEAACKEFNERWDSLAFPGGYSGSLERLVEGDPATVEAALCFLEERPYFFRSGYMFKDILKKAKRAPLEGKQAERLRVIREKLDAFYARRKAEQAGGG